MRIQKSLRGSALLCTFAGYSQHILSEVQTEECEASKVCKALDKKSATGKWRNSSPAGNPCSRCSGPLISSAGLRVEAKLIRMTLKLDISDLYSDQKTLLLLVHCLSLYLLPPTLLLIMNLRDSKLWAVEKAQIYSQMHLPLPES